MLLEKESKVLEKVKILSAASEYAEKAGRVWDSNLYHGEMYNCPPSKIVLNFMETFHTLDAFVYGSCDESGLFGCDPQTTGRSRSATLNRRLRHGRETAKADTARPMQW